MICGPELLAVLLGRSFFPPQLKRLIILSFRVLIYIAFISKSDFFLEQTIKQYYKTSSLERDIIL
jgi:hypothetical protein